MIFVASPPHKFLLVLENLDSCVLIDYILIISAFAPCIAEVEAIIQFSLEEYSNAVATVMKEFIFQCLSSQVHISMLALLQIIDCYYIS